MAIKKPLKERIPPSVENILSIYLSTYPIFLDMLVSISVLTNAPHHMAHLCKNG
jgi:hypothetical protein